MRLLTVLITHRSKKKKKKSQGRQGCVQKYGDYGFWDNLADFKKCTRSRLSRYIVDSPSVARDTLDRH